MNTISAYHTNKLLTAVGIIMLLAACNIFQSEPGSEERECPVKIGVDLDPPRHCYTYYMRNPSWSPDGQYIAYMSDDLEHEYLHGLFIFDLANQYKRLVIHGPNNMSSQAWSPDGEWIVFSMGAQIWKANVNGGSPIKLTKDDGGAYFDPAWSPDGEWIAFSMGAQIYKIRADGSELTKLTDDDSRAYFVPIWSPDGQWIAYSDGSAQSLGSTGLWVMRNDGSQKRWLTKYARSSIWSSDGNLFISRNNFVNSDWVYEIVLIDGEEGSDISKLWIDNKGIIYDLHYSPSLSQVVFQSQHRYEGDMEIWKINADGSGLIRLTFNGGTSPAWSPDGNTIAYVNIDYFEGGGFIWLMDADGTNRRPMIEEREVNE